MNRSRVRDMRKDVAEHTLKLAKRAVGDRVEPVETCYAREFVPNPAGQGARPPVRVVSEDALAASADLPNPVLLVNASANKPGGGFMEGMLGQEESLCYRTTLGLSLTRGAQYPIVDDAILHAPLVRVLKTRQYAPLVPPYREAGVLLVPEVRNPMTRGDGTLMRVDTLRLERRIRLALRVARRRGYESLVMGALGNPPRCVARAFRRVIDQEGASFSHLVFAIEDAQLARVFTEELVQW